jgi:microsomal dipeptidase-like Zn-dependent dipeptidase
MGLQVSIEALVAQVTAQVQQLKQALEAQDMKRLETVLPSLQAALEGLQRYPGGVEGLTQAIAQLPEPQRSQVQNALQQARHDHQVNAQLIALAMQRNAALQAYAAQSSSAATYSAEGAVPLAQASQLLGKF